MKLQMEAEERGVVSLEPLAEAIRSPASIAATGFAFAANWFAVARIIEAFKK